MFRSTPTSVINSNDFQIFPFLIYYSASVNDVSASDNDFSDSDNDVDKNIPIIIEI